MIDFVKIVITNSELISSLWSNPLLEYYSETDKRISIDEIRKTETRKFKNLKFTKYHNRIELTGSLHYYFNNGLHNANDFNVEDCINTVLELDSKLGLILNQCIIVNLEFGINVIPQFSAKKLITGIKYHERNEFRYYPNLKYAKQSSSFNSNGQLNQYKIIKAYAKGLQEFEGYETENKNLFRFEIKSKKGRFIRQLGINNLTDLTNAVTYQSLSQVLIQEWQKVLVLDNITALINSNKIKQYLSSDYWENVLQGHRNLFAYHKKRYFQLLKSNPSNIHDSIKNLISQKLDYLLEKGCAISPTPNNEEVVQIHKYIRGEYEQNKVCKVTGLNISMQKDNSSLLSHTGLRYYYENDRQIFDYVKRKYLSDQWINSKIEIQIREIAHNIRNHKNNMRLKQQKLYPPHQLHIFKGLKNLINEC